MDKNTDAAREKAKTDSRGAVIDAGLVLDRTSVPILDIGVNFGFDAGLAAASPAWVRIEGPESLPKEADDYLVQGLSGRIDVAAYDHNPGMREIWLNEVVAYMPLPQPYQAEPGGGE